MQDFLRKFDRAIWTRNLVTFAIASFLLRFGQGLLNGARINFFVDTLGLTSSQVLWLEGVRELPGLVLIFIAALTMLPFVLNEGREAIEEARESAGDGAAGTPDPSE